MEAYWPERLGQTAVPNEASHIGEGDRDAALADASSSDEDDYDRVRTQRLQANGESGWQAELERYLKDPAADVKKDTDTIWWWSVSNYSISINLRICQH